MPVVNDYTALLTSYSWNGFIFPEDTPGLPTVVTYSFDITPSAAAYMRFNNGFLATFNPFTDAQQATAEQALVEWASVSGLDFVEVAPGEGDIAFGSYDFNDFYDEWVIGFAFLPDRSQYDMDGEGPTLGGDVFIDGGTTEYFLFLHEIGHALGLDHPFSGPNVLEPELDTQENTIMSYGDEIDDPHLGPLDIDAIQAIYGLPEFDASNAWGLQFYDFVAATETTVQTWGTGSTPIAGTSIGDQIFAGSGDDSVGGFGGADSLFGALGDDMLYGHAGDDTLYGGDGDDDLDGGTGDDLLGGSVGDDGLWGSDGNDTLYGGLGDDHLNGGAGNDLLGGSDGADSLSGGEGDDAVWGSLGNDILGGEDGNDTLGGFFGDDSLYGSSGEDELWGADGSDRLSGGTEDDRVGGGAGDDTVEGDAGNDAVFGGAGDDVITGAWGDDSLFGGTGDDTLNAGHGSDVIFGGSGADVFVFGFGAFAGNDVVFGFDATSGDVLSLDASLWGAVAGSAAALEANATVNDNGNLILAASPELSIEMVGLASWTDLDGAVVI